MRYENRNKKIEEIEMRIKKKNALELNEN